MFLSVKTIIANLDGLTKMYYDEYNGPTLYIVNLCVAYYIVVHFIPISLLMSRKAFS